jgi:hypothetical protein
VQPRRLRRHPVPAADLPDHVDVVLQRQQRGQRTADQLLVIRQQDTDHAVALVVAPVVALVGTTTRSRNPDR